MLGDYCHINCFLFLTGFKAKISLGQTISRTTTYKTSLCLKSKVVSALVSSLPWNAFCRIALHGRSWLCIMILYLKSELQACTSSYCSPSAAPLPTWRGSLFFLGRGPCSDSSCDCFAKVGSQVCKFLIRSKMLKCSNCAFSSLGDCYFPSAEGSQTAQLLHQTLDKSHNAKRT